MEDLGTASDDQVILAWLQAEIESPPFQSYLIGGSAQALASGSRPGIGPQSGP
jgi:hypothetical protein